MKLQLGYNPKTTPERELLTTPGQHPRAFLGAIDKLTVNNESFRKVLYTGNHTQLVLMNLLPGEEIDREMHSNVDQFFRLEQGSIKVYVEGGPQDPSILLREILEATDGDAIIVPSGVYHRVVAGPKGAKLYTLYSPPNHPYDRVQRDKPLSDD